MTSSCSYCNTPLTALKITDAVFSLCPKCHSTFVRAKSFSSLRRDIDEGSRKQWRDLLREDSKRFVPPTGEIVCAEHGQPLTLGELPNVCIPGHVASCCDLLHLPPKVMADLLDRGLQNPNHSINSSSRKRRGLFRNISAWLLNKTDTDHGLDDGLDGMQWDMKLSPILNPKA